MDRKASGKKKLDLFLLEVSTFFLGCYMSHEKKGDGIFSQVQS